MKIISIMGTSGLFGFFHKGKYYFIYSHFDSYYNYLGVNLVEELRKLLKEGGRDALLEKFLALTFVEVNNAPIPSADVIDRLAPYTDLQVSNQSTADWYCLTRKMQSNYTPTLDSGIFYGTITDSIAAAVSQNGYIQYVYFIDFDNDAFVYSLEGDFESVDFDHLNKLDFLSM